MFTQVRLVRYTHTVGVAGGDEYLPENQMIIYWSVVSQLHAKPSTPHEKSVCGKDRDPQRRTLQGRVVILKTI